MSTEQDRGLTTFITIWLGQLVSIVGSGLTSFGLGVWVYQETGSASQFAYIFLFIGLATLVVSPVAGVMVDRHDRRQIMLLSDVVAGVATIVTALLFMTELIALWHIYIIAFVIAASNAFQMPAYMASIPLLVPPKQLGRINGLMQVAQAIRQVVAPALAGFLLLTIGIEGILLIDIVTFAFGILTLSLVRFPSLPKRDAAQKGATFWHDAKAGWTYIQSHSGLVAILIVVALFMFILSIVGVLITPMILAFSTAATLGILTSIGGVGALIGGLVMSAWGGPKRRINGVLGFLIVAGFLLILHGLSPSEWLIGLVAFPFFFTTPFIFGSNDVIWQTRVPPELLGRVLATRQMLMRSLAPFGYLIAGMLADQIFEPLLTTTGPLANSLGRMIGVGPGRGIAFMFMIGGALVMLIAAAGYLYAPLRLIEDQLPNMTKPTQPASIHLDEEEMTTLPATNG